MSDKRKNRLSFLNKDSEPENIQIKHNRIKRIEATRVELTHKKYVPLLILSVITVVIVVSVILVTKYFDKPQIFKSSEKNSNNITISDLEKKGIIKTLRETSKHLRCFLCYRKMRH